MTAAIETHELTKTFDGTVAVDRLDLCVAPAQVFGFLGPTVPVRRPRSARCWTSATRVRAAPACSGWTAAGTASRLTMARALRCA